MKRFYLQRTADVSGVSGIGNVLEGCLFDNGKVAITWLSDMPMTTVCDSIDWIIKTHGHEGKTKLVWVDDESSNVIVTKSCVNSSGCFRRLKRRHPDHA